MPNPTGPYIEGSLTLTIRSVETGGALVSLEAQGEWSEWDWGNLHYSIGELPPDAMNGREVWGQLLSVVAPFLANP